MNKKMIGVLPLIDNYRKSFWMLPGYMKGIEEAGAIPVILPLTSNRSVIMQLAERFDGFLFTGGHDVSPELYGEEEIMECGECSIDRDYMEKVLLEEVLKRDKPVFGICRGIQFINAALGGSLYQDIPLQHPSDVEHHQSPPYDMPIHKVDIVENSPLYSLIGKDKIDVNSYHHQGIKKLSYKLLPMAYAEDGLVEAVYMPDKKFVWAVQWHPEFSFNISEDSRKIFKAFVTMC